MQKHLILRLRLVALADHEGFPAHAAALRNRA